MREEIRCTNVPPRHAAACGTMLGEIVNGRLEVTRTGLIARGGEVLLKCRACGGFRLIDLAPDAAPIKMLDRVSA